MEYISAEEFLRQPKEVQQVFRDYAENTFKKFDLVYVLDDDKTLHISGVLDTRKDNINVGRVFYINNCPLWDSMQDPNIVPLFTETSLRRFIRQHGIIEIQEYEDGEFTLELFVHGTRKIMVDSCDLLQAYWQVACERACEIADDNKLIELIQERQKNDDGTRYTSEDIKRLRNQKE